MRPQLIQLVIRMLVITPKTKCSCQVIRIISTPVMDSQIRMTQQILDIAKLLTGQERWALGIVPRPTYITIFIGLVLLAETVPTSHVMLTAMAASTPTLSAPRMSTPRTPVCAQLSQSRLRSSQINKRIQTRLWI